MKKQRGNGWKCAAMSLAILAAAAMAACGSDAEGSEETLRSEESASAVAAVEEDASDVEETEAAEPEETSEPEEAEAEGAEEVEESEPVLDENDPNVIDGIDFTRYNNHEDWLYYPVSNMNYDSLRILAIANGHAFAILKDGDAFEMDPEENVYSFFVYVPKEAEDYIVNNEEDEVIVDKAYSISNPRNEEEEAFVKIMPFVFHILGKIIGENLEVSITVTYKDGTEETITTYITKNYEPVW